MPRDFTFNGASVPQKEVECSGEAARDMANDNTTVFENGTTSTWTLLKRTWQVGSNQNMRRQFEGGDNIAQVREASGDYLSAATIRVWCLIEEIRYIAAAETPEVF